jgi:uncharacterized protein YraI
MAMASSDDKFVLFSDVGELAAWLTATSFSRVIRLLQCHHTYLPDYHQFDGTNHFTLLHGMEAAHLERGFSEIAQNLTTFPDGKIAACRPIDFVPAGIKGANRNGICIENLGNFDLGQDTMSAAHRDCIIGTFAALCNRFYLQPDVNSIVYNHWYDLTTGQRTNGTGDTKSCPGTNFFGGNTVQAAQANFIPVVVKALAALGAPSTPPAQALYTADVMAEVLNVRAQPSTAAATVGQLKQGTEVSVYDEQAMWCRIDPVESKWVNGQFLASTASPAGVQAQYAAQVVASALNIRSAASEAASVSGQVPHGANVYVFEERGGWCRIAPSNSQWVKANYLSRIYSPVLA